MALTALTWMAWVVLLGGPILGILAVVLLSVFHEHKDPQRINTAHSGALGRGRRASTDVFVSYLLDEQEAKPAERRKMQAQVVTPMVRASTEALDQFLYDRATSAAAVVPGRPTGTSARPALRQEPTLRSRPVAVHALRIASTPVHGDRRYAGSTRLMPLSPEIAVG